MLQGSALPAFFDASVPTDPVWSQLEQGVSSIPIIAVFDNPTILAGVYSQIVAAGITIYGYVNSSQGSVPLGTIGPEIDAWFAQFPDLSGMFVDEGPPLDSNDPENPEPAATLAYYEAVYQRIKGQQPAGRTAPPPSVMLNCGGLRDNNFATNCLDVAMWEQDYPTYINPGWWQAATGNGGEWWTDAPGIGKLAAHNIWDVPQGDQSAMQQAISLANSRNANFIYVFDGSSNSYNRLPTFWSGEVAALSALLGGPVNSVIARPQSPAPQWTVNGAADAAAALARPVEQPAMVDSSQYIWAGGSPGAVAEVSVGAPPEALDPAQAAEAWFYANTGSTTTLLAEVVIAGDVAGSISVTPDTGFAWHQIQFGQNALPTGQVFLRFTGLNGGDSNVRAAYVQFATQS